MRITGLLAAIENADQLSESREKFVAIAFYANCNAAITIYFSFYSKS